uniref:Uncharacterized protein n=1 Tax=Trichuris muris TaxID=70415 RepID=A0A5S6Q716_TRIMR
MSRSGRSTWALTEATTSSVQDVSESQVDFGVDHGGIIQSSGANAPDEFGAKTHLNTQPDDNAQMSCTSCSVVSLATCLGIGACLIYTGAVSKGRSNSFRLFNHLLAGGFFGVGLHVFVNDFLRPRDGYFPDE